MSILEKMINESKILHGIDESKSHIGDFVKTQGKMLNDATSRTLQKLKKSITIEIESQANSIEKSLKYIPQLGSVDYNIKVLNIKPLLNSMNLIDTENFNYGFHIEYDIFVNWRRELRQYDIEKFNKIIKEKYKPSMMSLKLTPHDRHLTGYHVLTFNVAG